MTSILVMLRPPESRAVRFDALAADGVTVRVAESLEAAMPLIGDADVLITLPPHLGDRAAALLAAGKRLKWVQLVSTGTDNVIEHLRGGPVALTNARGLHGHQMSEAALCAMLCLARQVPRAMRNQMAAKWDRYAVSLLAGKTVGIFGMGAIADALTPLLKALGMRVIGITGSDRTIAQVDEVRPSRDLTAAVGDLDFLIVLTPYSPATADVIDARVLAAMKPGAYLINLARGGIVDEDALLVALNTGALAGAALDVFAQEPLAPESPLWTHERVIVTPHIGGLHEGYAADVLALTAENLRRYRAGEPLLNRVDTGAAMARHAAE